MSCTATIRLLSCAPSRFCVATRIEWPKGPPQGHNARAWTNVTAREKRMQQEGTYICDACGEEIVVPIDVSAGESQEYVEDCPVCCRPNVVHVEIEDDGGVRVWAQKEA
jgi:hypothetical protein